MTTSVATGDDEIVSLRERVRILEDANGEHVLHIQRLVDERHALKASLAQVNKDCSQKLDVTTSRILELETVLSTVKAEAEARTNKHKQVSSDLQQQQVLVRDCLLSVASKCKHLSPSSTTTAALQEIDYELKRLQSQWTAIEGVCHELVGMHSQSSTLISQETSDLFATVNTLHNTIAAIKRKFTVKLQKAKDQANDLERTVERDTLERQALRLENERLKADQAQLSRELDSTQRLLNAKERDIDQLHEKLKEQESVTLSTQSQLVDAQSRVQTLQSEFLELQRITKQKLITRKQLLAEMLVKYDVQLERMQELQERLHMLLSDSAERERVLVERSYRKYEEQARLYARDFDELRVRNEVQQVQWRQQSTEHKVVVEELQQQISQLRVDKQALQESIDSNRATWMANQHRARELKASNQQLQTQLIERDRQLAQQSAHNNELCKHFAHQVLAACGSMERNNQQAESAWQSRHLQHVQRLQRCNSELSRVAIAHMALKQTQAVTVTELAAMRVALDKQVADNQSLSQQVTALDLSLQQAKEESSRQMIQGERLFVEEKLKSRKLAERIETLLQDHIHHQNEWTAERDQLNNRLLSKELNLDSLGAELTALQSNVEEEKARSRSKTESLRSQWIAEQRQLTNQLEESQRQLSITAEELEKVRLSLIEKTDTWALNEQLLKQELSTMQANIEMLSTQCSHLTVELTVKEQACSVLQQRLQIYKQEYALKEKENERMLSMVAVEFSTLQSQLKDIALLQQEITTSEREEELEDSLARNRTEPSTEDKARDVSLLTDDDESPLKTSLRFSSAGVEINSTLLANAVGPSSTGRQPLSWLTVHDVAIPKGEAIDCLPSPPISVALHPVDISRRLTFQSTADCDALDAFQMTHKPGQEPVIDLADTTLLNSTLDKAEFLNQETPARSKSASKRSSASKTAHSKLDPSSDQRSKTPKKSSSSKTSSTTATVLKSPVQTPPRPPRPHSSKDK